MFTYHDLIRSLREGRFTSVGSYPKFWLASDGETLSYAAVMENLWQVARATRDGESSGWAIVGCDVNWEDGDMLCAHTNEPIECAYPSDDA